ncbi:MAG: hypothetical protein GY953_43620 [bacterium]|nr:hypothetical protein [bacterium]
MSLVPLLKNPKMERARPALTTHGRGNHSIRDERWRYIRYNDGTEELYDHADDPLEWKNLAKQAEHTGTKTELAMWLPKADAPESPRDER